MEQSFEDRCFEYLEGTLSSEETSRFERELVVAENMELFREVLVVREMMASVGPDAAPEGLAAAIAEQLGVSEDVSAAAVRRRWSNNPTVATARAAANGLAWAFWGPGLAVGLGGGNRAAASLGSRQMLRGVGTMRFGLGPLNDSVSMPKVTIKQRRTATRVAGWMWRRTKRMVGA